MCSDSATNCLCVLQRVQQVDCDVRLVNACLSTTDVTATATALTALMNTTAVSRATCYQLVVRHLGLQTSGNTPKCSQGDVRVLSLF